MRGTINALTFKEPGFGAAQSAVAAVFERIPIELHQLPPRRSTLR
jgi:hypothetical protein